MVLEREQEREWEQLTRKGSSMAKKQAPSTRDLQIDVREAKAALKAATKACAKALHAMEDADNDLFDAEDALATALHAKEDLS